MRTVVAIAFSVLFFTATSGKAEQPLPGIRFDIMPVGCRIHGQYGDGTKVIDEYVGTRNSQHLTKTFGGANGTDLVRTTAYNPQGFMVKKVWANNKWETFTPYSCFGELGSCKYTFRNADGVSENYVGKTVKSGKKLVSSGGFVGQQPFNKATILVGPFNNDERFSEGATKFRVLRYENCGNDLMGS